MNTCQTVHSGLASLALLASQTSTALKVLFESTVPISSFRSQARSFMSEKLGQYSKRVRQEVNASTNLDLRLALGTPD